MSVEVFREILDKLSPDLIYLTLYFQGEPLLNPHFTEMVALARSRRIFVSTSTNGHFLDQRNVDQIISSGLNHLVISMDGLDQQTYEKYRVKGDLQTVTDGLGRLVAAKKLSKTNLPFIELQFLVMRHNEHQMNQMREYSHQAGVDKLSFKTTQVYNLNEADEIVPLAKEFSRYRHLPDGSWALNRKLRNHCHRIWSSLVVTWDGKVVPCCYDKNADFQTGNLLEDSLEGIWKNQVALSFRRKLISNRTEIPICRNCGE